MYPSHFNIDGHLEADDIQTKLNGAVFYGTPPQKSLPDQLAQLNMY